LQPPAATVLTAEASRQPGTKAGEERHFYLGLRGLTGEHAVAQGAPALAGLTVGPRAELGMGQERILVGTLRLAVLTAEVAFCHLKACHCKFCSNKACLLLLELVVLLVSGED